MCAPGAAKGHGLRVFWGAGGEGAVQGVAELVGRKRVGGPDGWFLGVGDEFRPGALAERSRNYLCGSAASAPRSRVNGQMLRGDVRCRGRAGAIARSEKWQA